MATSDDRQKRTDKFITQYCSPCFDKNGRPPWYGTDRINEAFDKMVLEYENCYKSQITHCLVERSQPRDRYRKIYLTTMWWHIIKHKKKLDAEWKCTEAKCDGLCKTLEIHHKDSDYSFIGLEIYHMDTLETLCTTCHLSRHPEVKAKKPRKRRKRKSNVLKRGLMMLTGTKPDPEYDVGAFNSKVKSMFSEETTIESDPQKYVVTVETKTMTDDELHAAIIDDIDTLFGVLKTLR